MARSCSTEHHADAELVSSTIHGVRAHHWPFGEMPAIEGISETEAETIIAFLRAVQRANGIH